MLMLMMMTYTYFLLEWTVYTTGLDCQEMLVRWCLSWTNVLGYLQKTLVGEVDVYDATAVKIVLWKSSLLPWGTIQEFHKKVIFSHHNNLLLAVGLIHLPIRLLPR